MLRKLDPFLVVAVAWVISLSDNFDHQEKPYRATILPFEMEVLGEKNTFVTTPFFLPVSPLRVAVDIINAANTSLDIYTPGLKFWAHRMVSGEKTAAAFLPWKLLSLKCSPYFLHY